MVRWVVGTVIGVCALGLNACGSALQLNSQGENVRIGRVTPEGLRCSDLGVIYGNGNDSGYTSAEEKLESAQNDLRNKTAALGGNFVVMDASAGGISGISISGHALRCEEGAAPDAAMPVEKRGEEFAAAATPSATPAATSPAATAPSAEQRLRTLHDLHQKNLVTDDEYQRRRKEIIDSL